MHSELLVHRVGQGHILKRGNGVNFLIAIVLIKNTTAIMLINNTLALTHLEHPLQLGRELTTALGLEFAENKIYKFSPGMKTSILLFKNT